MPLVVRITIDEQILDEDVTLQALLDVAEQHPGNDVLEVDVCGRAAVRRFRLTQLVDSWDRGLRVDLEHLMGSSIFRD